MKPYMATLEVRFRDGETLTKYRDTRVMSEIVLGEEDLGYRDNDAEALALTKEYVEYIARRGVWSGNYFSLPHTIEYIHIVTVEVRDE